jgi:hypothetical protein
MSLMRNYSKTLDSASGKNLQNQFFDLHILFLFLFCLVHIDLTEDLDFPPSDLFVEVRVLKDLGEIFTEDGAIFLEKGVLF